MKTIYASSRNLTTAVACVIGVLLAGCAERRVDGAPGHQPASTLVDAPGTRSPRPRWASGAGWRLAANPSLRIGGVRRIGAVLVLDDRTVVVTDRDRGQIQYFSTAGTLRHALGGLGDGLGEFAPFTDMGLFHGSSSETILATDDGNGRVQIIRLDGTSIQSIQLQSSGRIIGVFDDGGWLVRLVAQPSRTRRGPIVHDLHYWKYDANGRPVAKIASTRNTARFVNGAGRISDYLIPFAAEATVAALGDRLWIAPGDDAHVYVYGFDGTLLQRHAWGVERRSSAEARSRFKQALIRLPDADRAVLAQLELPKHLPVYQRMLADGDGGEGNVWLERYRLRAEEGSETVWDVLDSSGMWLATVAMPPRFDVLHISSDMVLGRVHAEPGTVAELRGYHLARPAESRRGSRARRGDRRTGSTYVEVSSNEPGSGGTRLAGR